MHLSPTLISIQCSSFIRAITFEIVFIQNLLMLLSALRSKLPISDTSNRDKQTVYDTLSENKQTTSSSLLPVCIALMPTQRITHNALFCLADFCLEARPSGGTNPHVHL